MNARIIAAILLLTFCVRAQAWQMPHPPPRNNDVSRTDTGAAPVDSLKNTSKTKAPKPPYVHQFRFGFDMARIAANIMYPSRQSYEVQADYLLRNNVYLAGEAGMGKGKIDYDNLKYTAKGFFVKVGVEKQFLDIVGKKDFDIGFLGIRYGAGPGKRTDATYVVTSRFGAVSEGTVPAQNYIAHWGEITGGLKVEIVPHVFLGWSFRMRFLLNPGTFKELAPNFIPGYGQGDKTTAFDLNYYISYALRWGKDK
ncbi:MAG: DUF6048 family protein [Edaphocola sp.]